MPDNSTPSCLAAALANPFYAINIDPAFAESHQPLVTEDAWITTNVRTLEVIGPEAYLRNLLAILRSSSPRNSSLAPR